MQRYFIENCSSNVEILKGNSIYYHLVKVLRSKRNNIVELCDYNGECFKYVISDVNEEKLVFDKSFQLIDSTELNVKVILAISLLKNNNFELVLQKAVELGVTDIIPFESSRTIVKSNNFSESKLARFRKIILEASEQSKRFKLPILHSVVSIDKIYSNINAENKIVAYESSAINNHILHSLTNINSDVLIVIGPEGGFSNNEIDNFSDNGFKVVSLGKRILRAETAAISAVSTVCAVLESNLEVKKHE